MRFDIRYAAISLKRALVIISGLLLDLSRYVYLRFRPNEVLAAENLFLRKQLALYQERDAKPRRIDLSV